jgi:isocitrate/isopropylmalate dehydrogenase
MMFLRKVRKVAEPHPDVSYEEQLVDSMAACWSGMRLASMSS